MGSIQMNTVEEACSQCHADSAPLTQPGSDVSCAKSDHEWHMNQRGHIYRIFRCSDLMAAVEFANKVAAVAEFEGHSPHLHVSWGKCVVELWPRLSDGLSESDFVFAAKIDSLLSC
jgi:4a-hydroxytetrahydrobiopterin dehydratase